VACEAAGRHRRGYFTAGQESTKVAPTGRQQGTGGDTAENFTVFTQNVRIYQMGKYGFIEGFFCFSSGAKARLA